MKIIQNTTIRNFKFVYCRYMTDQLGMSGGAEDEQRNEQI